MSKNNGVFTVLKRKDKYVIVYIERGETTYLDMYSFDRELDAQEYLNNKKVEIDAYVSTIKEEAAKKEAERIAVEEAKKEEKRKKEEEKQRKKEEKRRKKEERKEKRKNFWKKGWVRFTSGAVAMAIFLVGGHWAWFGISNLVEKNKKPTSSQVGSTEPTKDVPNTEPTKNESNIGISNGIDNIINKDEELNQENFEELATNFVKIYSDKGVNVSTEDLIKFVSIVNIDALVEENPEFAQELFGTQTKEEYLQDAAKVIGITYTYNRNVFEKERSTKNFIRISDSVYGPQKALLQIVEGYVDQIALVKDNEEEVNKLITELIVRLGDPQSELSYLDDGVGFGMQVYITLIRSYLAKDVISKENFDMLSVLTSSEEYVSNIFTTYDGCISSYSKKK